MENNSRPGAKGFVGVNMSVPGVLEQTTSTILNERM